MLSSQSVLFAILALSIVLAGYILIAAPRLLTHRSGKLLVLVGVFLLPCGSAVTGVSYNMEQSKQTDFCLSCHEMEPYGQSLHIDDEELIPALHFQRRLVPRELACYTCHKDYAMFGSATSKLNGLRHVYAHYIGGIPETIKLYKPFPNANCLSCHQGARKFEDSEHHHSASTPRSDIQNGTISCLSSGCHDVAHTVDELSDAEFWEPTTF